jgi:cytoskeleton protein RodZ
MLQATENVWVQVRRQSGGVLLTRIMKAGDTWAVPTDPDLILDTGNAGGLELVVDGVPTKLPAAKGGVIHNLPLDADLFGAGTVQSAR